MSFVNLTQKLESYRFNNDHFVSDIDNNYEATYSEFIRDVSIVYEKMQTVPQNIIIVSYNSYNFLVYFLASFILDKKIAILNPNDYTSQIKLFDSSFIENSRIFSSSNLGDDCELLTINHQQSPNVPLTFFNEGTIYIPTSSTTGVSKIVPLRKDSIINNALELVTHHEFNKDSIIGTPLPLYHVNALFFAFFSSFLAGSRLVIFNTFNPKLIFQTTSSLRITHLSLIPQILHSILRNWESLSSHDISSLKYFISAASSLGRDLALKVYEKTGKRIIQGYGLSEIVNFSCITPVDLSEESYSFLYFDLNIPTIGTSLPSNTITVVDTASGGVCKEGEIGELCIQSSNTIDDYYNFHSTNLFNLYGFKTGDLGHFIIHNGSKYFFINGRIKEIAKINGESIPLKELDDSILKLTILDVDFFLSSFPNEYRGEELTLVTNENDVQMLLTKVKLVNEALVNFKIKVICISDNTFRTSSGKPKRNYFRNLLSIYRDRRFLTNELIVYKCS